MRSLSIAVLISCLLSNLAYAGGEIKEVCKEVTDKKTGKVKQECKKIKVHKKLETATTK